MPELTRLERTKSMMRYLPPNGTAGLARSRVRGCSRVPCPPAITSASVLICAKGLESSLRGSPHRNQPAKYRCPAPTSEACASFRLIGRPIVTKPQEFPDGDKSQSYKGGIY